METEIIQESKVQVINKAIAELSPVLIDALHEYVLFLVERERKHKAFVERVLSAEKESSVICNSVDELMQAIDNAN